MVSRDEKDSKDNTIAGLIGTRVFRLVFEMLNPVDIINFSLINKTTNALPAQDSFKRNKLIQLGLLDSKEANNFNENHPINKLAMLLHYVQLSDDLVPRISIDNSLDAPYMIPIRSCNNNTILKLLYSKRIEGPFLNICRKNPAASSLVMTVPEWMALLPRDEVVDPNPKAKLTKSMELYMKKVSSNTREISQMFPIIFFRPINYVVWGALCAAGVYKKDKYVPVFKVAAFFNERIDKKQAKEIASNTTNAAPKKQ